MKAVVVGAHLRREDVEPLATAIAASGLWLSGVDVADDQPLSNRELLVRVASVRARLLERATFIAIRYGFAVRSEADANAKVAAHAERWRALLEQDGDAVEMTLKVAAAQSKPRPNRADFTSGAAYMRALHEATHAAVVEPAFREAVEAQLVPLARRHRWQTRDTTSVELAALVARADVRRFLDAGAELKASFASVPFLLSGPWPLEVFAEEEA